MDHQDLKENIDKHCVFEQSEELLFPNLSCPFK